MKPSLGRVPGGGPNPPGWLGLSTNGPMAMRIADVARALDVAVGPDPTDLQALPRPEASWLAALDDPHVPVRVAYSPTLGYATVDTEVAAACERAVSVLESLGAEITGAGLRLRRRSRRRLPDLHRGGDAAHAAALLGHPRWEEVHPVLRHFVNWRKETTAEQILQIFDHYHLMNLRLVELFRRSRILVTPTTSAVAPFAGELESTVKASGPQLGPVHVPVQHDQVAGGHGAGGHEPRGAADRGPG